MQVKKRKVILFVSRIVAGLLLLTVILFFIFRPVILRHYVEKITGQLLEKYNIQLSIKESGWDGIHTITFSNLFIRYPQKDTLLTLKSVNVRLKFWKLFTGKIMPRYILLQSPHFHILTDSVSGHSFQPDRSGKQSSADTLRTACYSCITNRILNAFFDYLPARIRIMDFQAQVISGKDSLSVVMERLDIRDHHWKAIIQAKDNTSSGKWQFKGTIHSGNKNFFITLIPVSRQKGISVPFLSDKWNVKMQFDTLEFSLHYDEQKDNMAVLNGNVSFRNLLIAHPLLSSRDIFISLFTARYNVHAAKHYIELDSSGVLQINRLSLRPYIKYSDASGKQLTIRLDKNGFPAQDLFSSLPSGLFTRLNEIQAEGTLSAHLFFYVDFNRPDSLVLESRLQKKNFSIKKYGKAELTGINGSFVYTAYENGHPVRSFTVGEENPFFRSIDQVPALLKEAVLISEDGGFFTHRGFHIDAFKESIASNIKQQRFVRGGSTITMQLVKNVFLSREKTVSRKLEEMLMVWLIEQNRLISKERMFEVYLNIIEWGPCVYGAAEASAFYFGKDVSQLTLAESIYLAAIIPRPKMYAYFFDNGHLIPWLADYYKVVSERMLKKGVITPADIEKLVPDIQLKGPAKLKIMKTGTLPADSLIMDDFGL